MKTLSSVRGLLVDLDGVLYVGRDVIPGSREALQSLRESGLQLRFVTNTTTRSADAVVEKLQRLGFEIAADEVFSAVTATLLYLQSQGNPSVHLVVRDSILEAFEEFPQDSESPDYVVIGDIGAAWSYPLMNRIFRQLDAGASLVAMHRNRFFQSEDGLTMDIGGFVAGLEYVSGRTATIVGKPSRDFFQLGLDSMDLSADEALMIGDDVESDVGGAQEAGLRGVLVRTGKFRPEHLESSDVSPDAVVDSLEQVPELLGI